MSEGRWAIALDFLRAGLLRLRGARMGAKCRVGRHCEASNPPALTFGTRVVLEAGVVLKLVSSDASVSLGDHVFIGRGSIFDVTGALTIGSGTLIAPGCFVTDHNHGIAPGQAIWTQPCTAQAVRIGKDAWLGARAVVLPGVTIGDGAVVAAGAVVTRDVAPMTVVAGVPARFVRFR